MRRLRLRFALPFAIGAHALAIGALVAPSTRAIDVGRSDPTIDVEVTTTSDEPAAAPPRSAVAATASIARAAVAAGARARAAGGERAEAPPSDVVAPASATSAGVVLFGPPPSAPMAGIDLPLAARYGRATDSVPDERDGRPARPSARDSVVAALDEHDRSLGLDPSAPLVAVVEDAARTSRVPIESVGEIVATTDARGAMVTVTATPDTDAWRALAAAIVQAMRERQLRVPSGAKGLRIAMRVESRERSAAGHSTDRSRPHPGMVTSESPASDRTPSVALGTPRYRCLEGCTASGNIDPTDALANATSHASRAVRVRTVATDRLH